MIHFSPAFNGTSWVAGLGAGTAEDPGQALEGAEAGVRADGAGDAGAPAPDVPRHGRGERSRSQLLFKLAGTGTRLILGWLLKFGW